VIGYARLTMADESGTLGAMRALWHAIFQPLLAEHRGQWSERRDLNPRPLVPQTSALTGLRYAPTIAPYRRSPSAMQSFQTRFTFATAPSTRAGRRGVLQRSVEGFIHIRASEPLQVFRPCAASLLLPARLCRGGHFFAPRARTRVGRLRHAGARHENGATGP
jgi:hypothetical protein